MGCVTKLGFEANVQEYTVYSVLLPTCITWIQLQFDSGCTLLSTKFYMCGILNLKLLQLMSHTLSPSLFFSLDIVRILQASLFLSLFVPIRAKE